MLCLAFMVKKRTSTLQVDMDGHQVNQDLSDSLLNPPKTASGGVTRHVDANQMELFNSLRTR